MAQQQTIVTTTSPPMAQAVAPPPTTRSNYNETGGRVTGWIQIICGVASIVFGTCMWLVITGVIVDPSLGFGHLFVFFWFGWLSVPIWCGVIFIISGSLGAASRKHRTCLIGGYMAMSIISIFFASGQLVYESIVATVTKCKGSDDYYYNDGSNDYGCQMPEVYYGMHVGSALAAFIQIVVALAGSILCCLGSCGSSASASSQQMTVVYTTQIQQPQGGPYTPPPPCAPQQQGNYPTASVSQPYPQKY